jgi:hypothetical protein
MKKRLIALLLMSLMTALLLSSVGGTMQPSVCTKGTPYRGCPACGTVRGDRALELNVLKNRDEAATNPKKITVAEIRDPQNNTKFSPGMQIEVTAYVAEVSPGGLPETCNCKRHDLRDIMINIAAGPEEAGDLTKYVVVEITPRWEKKFGFDDSNYEAMREKLEGQIKGKWVTFRGWMLYDYLHLEQSESTAPGNKSNWRATPWEIHPVTSYQMSPGPPSK